MTAPQHFPHLPVLKEEVIQAFASLSLPIFVDGTLGAGGHAETILQTHPEITAFIGIDQDPSALDIARNRLNLWQGKVTLVHNNFSELKNILAKQGISQVQGILLDLGVSSMQLDQGEKGFSFMRDGPLDMRMDPTNELTAEEIVNTWSEKELGRIFRDYGEEKRWRAASQLLVEKRRGKPIKTTFELVETLRPAFFWNKKGMHPLTLIFQALRIAVNRELEVIEKVIPEAIELLAKGGRMGVITFHSLEDRIVKNAFRFGASDKFDTSGIAGVFLDKEPTLTLVTRKPIVATDEEIGRNPRSRSAKLRVVEKL